MVAAKAIGHETGISKGMFADWVSVGATHTGIS